MSHLRSFLTFLIVFAALSPAFAQPSANDKASARKLIEKGIAAEAAGDLAGAEASFATAHAIMRVPTTGLYLAKVRAKLNKLVEARDVALEASRLPVQPGELPAQPAARVEAAKLSTDLTGRIPSIQFQLTPPDTAIDIDGSPIPPGATAVARDINPGAHRIVARHPQAQESTQDVVLNEREKRIITIALPLNPVEAPVAPPPRAVSFERDPPGWVWLMTIGGFVGGAGAGVAGGVTGGIVLSNSDEILAQCSNGTCPASVEEDLSETTTLSHVSTGAFIGAGVFTAVGITGAVLAASWPKKKVFKPTASGFALSF
jgi:hypothetical protein